MIADIDEEAANFEQKPLYQNQMADPEVRAAYDDYLNLVLNTSTDTLPDLEVWGTSLLKRFIIAVSSTFNQLEFDQICL